jgi:ceramide glucosyltransferase
MLRSLVPFIAILPATAYCLISLFCARRFFRRTAPAVSRATAEAGVTILKPVRGMDAGSYDNFASFCRQEYSGPLQMIFAAAAADDAVIPVIRRLITAFPEHDISLVVNPAIHGPNYKVSNLINAFPRARHDIIIVCDSDIRVTPDYLNSVTSHFADPRIGLVTSLYRTSCVHNFAAALEATGFTVEMIPNVLVALQLEGLSFALGASMAVRRAALASIGGFEALVDYLADDYQLGNKVCRAGWGIALEGCFVESVIKTESLLAVVSRQLRWARTMRVSRFGGFLASGITLPFPAACMALLAAPSLLTGLSAVALLYAVRLAVSTIFSRCFVRDGLLPRWLWLLPLRDLLAFSTWALSFLGNRVEWRGSCFKLTPGGKIVEITK